MFALVFVERMEEGRADMEAALEGRWYTGCVSQGYKVDEIGDRSNRGRKKNDSVWVGRMSA